MDVPRKVSRRSRRRGRRLSYCFSCQLVNIFYVAILLQQLFISWLTDCYVLSQKADKVENLIKNYINKVKVIISPYKDYTKPVRHSVD